MERMYRTKYLPFKTRAANVLGVLMYTAELFSQEDLVQILKGFKADIAILLR